MVFEFGLHNVINATSGLALMLLGAYVASIRPRRRGTLAFAAFAILLGWTFFLGNILSDDDPLSGPFNVSSAVTVILASLCLGAVAIAFPSPLRAAERPLARRALVLAAVLGLASLPAQLRQLAEDTAPGEPPLAVASFVFSNPGLTLLGLAMAFTLALLALRFASPQATDLTRRQDVLMSAAVVLYPGVVSATDFANGCFEWRCYAVYNMVVHGALAALWLRASWATSGASARLARNVAVLVLAVPVVTWALIRDFPDNFDPEAGVSRLLMVALLTYAILRHQLLGLDHKVQWTIKQSTVAAAFVGVFFVASEIAQQFFASETNSSLMGIAAAGLLVFAMAPLQHAAERVARAAIPDGRPVAELGHHERAEIYRQQAVAAWADGVLSKDERHLLDQLRDNLALSRDEASRIESEVARS